MVVIRYLQFTSCYAIICMILSFLKPMPLFHSASLVSIEPNVCNSTSMTYFRVRVHALDLALVKPRPSGRRGLVSRCMTSFIYGLTEAMLHQISFQSSLAFRVSRFAQFSPGQGSRKVLKSRREGVVMWWT